MAGHTGGVTWAAAALMGQACRGFTCIDCLECHPLSGNVSPKQCTERMTGQLVIKQSLCAGGQVSHMDVWKEGISGPGISKCQALRQAGPVWGMALEEPGECG